MPIGLNGSIAPPRYLAAALPPLLTVAYALQCEGLPQQFPAPPQSQNLGRGNSGFALVVQVLDGDGGAIDVSAATGLELLLVWPGGQVQVVPASFYSNGTDGKVAAALAEGLGGGWGLYLAGARVTLANQVLETYYGRLWYGRPVQ